MSGRDDDGAEIVALARKMGLPGILPASSTTSNPPRARASTNADDDGADVVALARQYGLVGFSRTDK